MQNVSNSAGVMSGFTKSWRVSRLSNGGSGKGGSGRSEKCKGVNLWCIDVKLLKMKKVYLASSLICEICAIWACFYSFLSLRSLQPQSIADDVPGNSVGSDLDLDDGVVRYTTPTDFVVAFKTLALITEAGATVNLISPAAVLSDSIRMTLSEGVSLTEENVTPGVYESIYAEVYYYELEMEMNVPTVSQRLRVYLSDDDFESEGSLGHHQGDITLLDEDGVELGFVPPGEAWTTANVLSDRGLTQGAGETDGQTGHARGLYGDTSLWNQVSFNQGAGQDLFVMTLPLNLTLSAGDEDVVSMVFSLENAWFYEDFDDNLIFNPAGGGREAISEGAAWTPIFPTPNVTL